MIAILFLDQLTSLRFRLPILLVISVITLSQLYSQEWTKLLPEKSENELTFYDYQNAFNSYWEQYEIIDGYFINEEGEKQKAGGWKQFKRWEYFWQSRIERKTGVFPRLESRNIIKQLNGESTAKKRSVGSDNWVSLGPNSTSGGYYGIGRINCISFHPTDNNTFWVGSASGGIWKTTDGGSSWNVLTHGTAVLAVSDIIIPSDYTSSNTIYIATGDRDARDNYSVGVLKSTDGGNTWASTGLSYSVANGEIVSRLLCDPGNDQIIIAATKDGVYRTSDGGVNWDDELTTERFTELEHKPGDFNTLYGGTRYGGEIWRTTDGGSTWQNTLNTSGERVEIAVSADDPSIVYALVAAGNSGLLGVYKSTDSGANFTLMYDGTLSNQNLLGWDSDAGDSGGQGWYDLSLEANPFDADMLFVGGVNTWKSIDGANDFTIANHWYGAGGIEEVHADKHKICYRSNGDLFECNDGGLYISTNDGATWMDITNGMVIGQIYKISVAQTVPNDVISGLQDNGTINYNDGTWDNVLGGDGMDCAIDYTDENVQYGESQRGNMRRTTNHWSNDTNITPTSEDGAWVTPFVLDPVDHETIYAGYHHLYKSTNRGNDWSIIYNLNSSEKFRTLAVAPSNTQVIYAGEINTLWKTSNGGDSWSDITSGLPSNTITSIAVNHDNEDHLWVSIGSYSGNTIYESTDGGLNWNDISIGLPDVPVNCIIQNTQTSNQIDLFAGTDNGVYFKGGSNDWLPFNNGLPNVIVSDMDIYYDPNDPLFSKIRAGTYGRGLWESPINEPVPIDPDQSHDLLFSNVTTDAISLSWTNGSGSKRIVKISDYSSIGLPQDGTDPIANTTYGGGEQVIYNGAGAPVTVSNLDPRTTYFFRVFDYDGSGESTEFNTAPGVNNPISIETYCEPTSLNIDDDYIARFVLNSIDNISGESTYTDFSYISTQVLPNNSYDVSVEVGNFDEYLSLWIDWNDNQEFEDSEKLIDEFICTKNTLSTTTMTIPDTDNYGAHLMRVRVSYYEGADGCSDVSYGEAEDYTVEFKAKITWTGAINSDWFEPLNWDVGVLPGSGYEVIIPNATNQPVINSGLSAFAKKVTTETGAFLEVHGNLNIMQ